VADYNKIHFEALELARSGQIPDALALLERSLHDPLLKEDHELYSFLARSAGVISELAGSLDQAYSYFCEALEFAKDKASMLYGIAELSLRMGDKDRARTYFLQCYEICVATKDQKHLDLLEARAKFWK
jgi:tetratricopeptide (TPR) repeat protein